MPALYYAGQISVRVNALAQSYYQQKTFTNPFYQIPIAISSYIQLILWPDKLTLYHSEMTFSYAEYFLRLGAFLAFLIGVIYGFLKNKHVFFWLCLFIISLIPTLTPFGISWIVAERYVYLGSVGILYIIGYLLTKLIKNNKTAGSLLFVAVTISLLTRTFIRNFDWKNEDNLWIATGKTSPSDPKTHNNLGDVYRRQGNLEKSAEEFKIALKLKPNYADVYHNLANTYTRMGKISDAIATYQTAIKYNPKLWQSYENLAIIYFNQKHYDLAQKSIGKAIEINPGNANLHVDLGAIYWQIGNKGLAKQSFTEALKLDPQNALAKNGMPQMNK